MNKLGAAALGDPRVAALLRQDLYSFGVAAFEVVNPATPFLPAFYLKLIAARLDACGKGEIRRLVINLPPRYGKSHFASVALPAFLLAHDPTLRILCSSYGLNLAEKLHRDFLTVIESDVYRAVFGAQSVRRQQANEFVTTAGGCRVAGSFGGALTGRGFDVIIIDDPLKAGDARARKKRQKVNAFYQNTVVSRLDDKAKGRIIIAMQRLHARDLVGHVLEQEGEAWEVLALPALAEKDETIAIPSEVFGPCRFTRKRGAALHPQRDSIAQLQKIRETIGSDLFASQYQQKPRAGAEAIIKPEWLIYVGPGEWPERFDRVIQSWDTASKSAELNDYSVCTTWGIKDVFYYLIDVLRKKLGYPELKRAVYDLRRRYRPEVILIEDKASGTPLIQDLLHEGLSEVRGFKTPADKIMRLNAQSPAIEAGRVRLPRKAPWLNTFVDELTSFPDTEHDDQVDSVSQFLEWIKQSARSSNPAILAALCRQTAAPTGTVRLIAPPGVNAWQAPYRSMRTVDNDGTLEIEECFAVSLLRAGWKRA